VAQRFGHPTRSLTTKAKARSISHPLGAKGARTGLDQNRWLEKSCGHYVSTSLLKLKYSHEKAQKHKIDLVQLCALVSQVLRIFPGLRRRGKHKAWGASHRNATYELANVPGYKA
jgi:hypothetical protein